MPTAANNPDIPFETHWSETGAFCNVTRHFDSGLFTCTRDHGHAGEHIAAFCRTDVCRDTGGLPCTWPNDDNEESTASPIPRPARPAKKDKKLAFAGSPLLQVAVRRRAGESGIEVTFKSAILAQFVDEIHEARGWEVGACLPWSVDLRRAANEFAIESIARTFVDHAPSCWWIFLPDLRTGHVVTSDTFTTRAAISEWLTWVNKETVRFYTEHVLALEYDLEVTTREVERVPRESRTEQWDRL